MDGAHVPTRNLTCSVMEQQHQEVAGRGSIEESNHCRWVISALETGLRSFIEATLIGCTVILVLSKREEPHNAPLRAYVGGYLSGCVAYFALSLFRVCVGGYPLVGRQGKAIRSCSILLAFFFVSWVIAGCVWVSTARSTSSDTPLLYWTSVVLVFSSGVIGGLILTISYKAEW